MFKPKYTITDNMLSNIVKIELDKQSVALQELTSQDINAFNNHSKAVSIFHLAHIIGVEMTLKDAQKAVEGKKISTPDARGAILNNFKNVLDYVRANLADSYIDLEINVLVHLNKIILTDWKETWEARTRSSASEADKLLDNWTGIRDPEPGLIEDRLNQLIDWYKNSQNMIHPLIRIGIVILEMIRIAPFQYCNQLTILAIIDFLMYRNNISSTTFLPAIKDFDIHDQEYQIAWREAIDKDDMTVWLDRFIQNLTVEISDSKNQVLKKTQEEIKNTKQPFLDLNRRQLKILRYLQTIPTVKREDYVQMMDVSTMTAFRDLFDLVRKKLIKVEGKGRGTKYVLASR